jgi:hypothetical protein
VKSSACVFGGVLVCLCLSIWLSVFPSPLCLFVGCQAGVVACVCVSERGCGCMWKCVKCKWNLLTSLYDSRHQRMTWGWAAPNQAWDNHLNWSDQGILKGEVSLYHRPPVWLIWNQLYDNWQFLFLFAKQSNLTRSNRRSMVQWYFPL